MIVRIPRVTALTPVALDANWRFCHTECSHLCLIVCRMWRPWWLTQSRVASTPLEASKSSSPCLHSWITASRPATSWTPLSGKHLRTRAAPINRNDFCLSVTRSKSPHVGVLWLLWRLHCVPASIIGGTVQTFWKKIFNSSLVRTWSFFMRGGREKNLSSCFMNNICSGKTKSQGDSTLSAFFLFLFCLFEASGDYVLAPAMVV